jgi:regulator of Ty1 transposition protein 103
MAYTDDSVRAKLSALNETQEGIVTVAQWVMFHRSVKLNNQKNDA